MYAKLAPFHFARLEAAGKVFNEKGLQLVCVEIAGKQSNYPWRVSQFSSNEFIYVSLFDDKDYLELGYLKVRKAIKTAFDRLAPDVVVMNGWGHKESIAALAWCLNRGVPRAVISDSQYTDHPRRFWKERLKKLFVAQCHSGFAGGASHIRYLNSLGLPAESCVIGCDVVDNAAFESLSEKRRNGCGNNPETPMRLLSCVRFLDVKNIPATLNAMSRLRLPWHWTIAGDGPERKNILHWIRKLGLQDRVDLPGVVAYESIPDLYKAADVYLQPSLSEPWGLAVNEAMASGLPVLVSEQCGCHEDLIRDGVNGYTFDARSTEDIAAGLEKMWECRQRWSEMGRESNRIIQFWSLDLFAQNLWMVCELAIERSAMADGSNSAVASLWKRL